jgi:hypothetical protein
MLLVSAICLCAVSNHLDLLPIRPSSSPSTLPQVGGGLWDSDLIFQWRGLINSVHWWTQNTGHMGCTEHRNFNTGLLSHGLMLRSLCPRPWHSLLCLSFLHSRFFFSCRLLSHWSDHLKYLPLTLPSWPVFILLVSSQMSSPGDLICVLCLHCHLLRNLKCVSSVYSYTFIMSFFS